MSDADAETEDDDKTPTRREFADDASDLADTAIAFTTVATRLRNAAELAETAAERCKEAARLVGHYGKADRAALLRDLEEQLGTLTESMHDTRRAVRTTRLGRKESR